MKRERNVALCILFSILTCGIYSLYWMACINNKVNRISCDRKAPKGGIVILLNIITFGIYELFWHYSMGQKIDKIKYNKQDRKSILYLILGIVSAPFYVIGTVFLSKEIIEKFLYDPYVIRQATILNINILPLLGIFIALYIKLIILCLMQNELNNLPESYNG